LPDKVSKPKAKWEIKCKFKIQANQAMTGITRFSIGGVHIVGNNVVIN